MGFIRRTVLTSVGTVFCAHLFIHIFVVKWYQFGKFEFDGGITMNEQVEKYLEKYPVEVIDMFQSLRRLIYDSISADLTETLWANLPSYYVGESFVRLVPFKDHINIEARAVILHRDELAGYKITPKGMVQIFIKQEVPYDVLKRVFTETLL